MRGRIVTAFVAGVMCCALFLGASVGAFYALSDDAQARDGDTWQVHEEGTLSNKDFWDWVTTMPVECDIQALHQGMGGGVIPYYRCPDS